MMGTFADCARIAHALMQPHLPPGSLPQDQLIAQGFCRVDAKQLAALADVPAGALPPLARYWSELPPDRYLRDGGRYRYRRHACFVQTIASAARGADAGAALQPVAHRPHWQSTAYNALHGGIERWFEPVDPALLAEPAWQALVGALGTLFARIANAPRWHIEAHQFRIDASEGVGRPTPEGAHRDGVDFVAVVLVRRRDVKGGETRVFEADGEQGVRFEMREPWSALLLDDARVIHETTPIQPDGPQPHRDTLVLTYRQA
jgi:hypothetical protein